MIDGQIIFDQSVRNDLITYNNFEKLQQVKEMISLTTGSLLDYTYFQKYKMIAIDLCKQEARDADPKAIQQISFTQNIENDAVIFFIIEEAKETVLDFPQGTVKVF